MNQHQHYNPFDHDDDSADHRGLPYVSNRAKFTFQQGDFIALECLAEKMGESELINLLVYMVENSDYDSATVDYRKRMRVFFNHYKQTIDNILIK